MRSPPKLRAICIPTQDNFLGTKSMQSLPFSTETDSFLSADLLPTQNLDMPVLSEEFTEEELFWFTILLLR